MNENLQEKMGIIRSINTDNARFVINVMDSFQKKELELENKKRRSKIILKQDTKEIDQDYIDLDRIWAKPYLYTKMYIKLSTLVTLVKETSIQDIKKNESRFLKKAIYNNAEANYQKTEQDIDIVEFLKTINISHIKNYEKIKFYAEKIDEESLFKEEQICKAIEIMQIDDINMRYSRIYDELNEYLDKDFIKNNYCDFQNNRCIAQRHINIYPLSRKNGCCYKEISKCNHLNEGKCTISCMACKLFSCPYLSKMGIRILCKRFYTSKSIS